MRFTDPTKMRVCSFGSARSGVIAVLFLFVVGFVFAAISLSMQVGQVIERRISSDQSADSAAYAMASKTAQGLNFIAANNLAIAGAAHMAGVMHLAADRGILLTTFFQAKSLFAGGSPKLTQGDIDAYDRVYSWFRPIAGLYFRSAIGLTQMNSAIRASFPYLAVIDAVAIGSANTPNALIVPFGWRPPAVPAVSNPASGQPVTKQPFAKLVIDKLKAAIKNMSLKYEGLDRIHADEAFCLAYEAGRVAMPENDYSELTRWLKGVDFPIIPALGEILRTAATMTKALGVIESWVGIRVGFAGCGFGETGEALMTQSPNVAKNQIGLYLYSVVKGPLSGRAAPVDFSAPSLNLLRPKKDKVQLANEVNQMADIASACSFSGNQTWKTLELATPMNPKTGVCIVPRKSLRKYPAQSANFESGLPFVEGGVLASNQIDLVDYEAVCHGTILFEWESYSGLEVRSNPADPLRPLVSPADKSYPDIDKANVDSDLCPAFKASASRNIYYPAYDGKPSHVNMSRGKPFLDEVVSGMINPNAEISPEHWRGEDPRPEALSKIQQLLDCAKRDPERCPQGYLENKDKEKYFPDLQRLDWLCPAGGSSDGRMANIRATLKFDNPQSPGRWIHSGVVSRNVPEGTAPKYVNKYIQLQGWHNTRVDELVNQMNCPAYEQFASKGIQLTNNQTQRVHGSNNYCDGTAHYCWQSAMQNFQPTSKIIEKGPISFLVKTPTLSARVENPLEASLHYAVLAVNPLRTDNGKDIRGRMDNSALANCPVNMEIKVTLEDNSTVQVCDVQPVVGFISRIVQEGQGTSELAAEERFGGGDANLASGGALGMSRDELFGTSGFMSIAQAGVKFQDNAPGAPSRPSAPKSNAKNYQMFWPSWHPVMEPSRVISRIMPPSIAPLMED